MKNSFSSATTFLKISALAVFIGMASGTAYAAVDNGLGDDLSKTGYFTVASYKAFGPDNGNEAGVNGVMANAATLNPAGLNAITPASGSNDTRPAVKNRR